jgi:hypothetical protein
MITASSTVHDDVPEVAGTTRAFLHFQGTLIEPHTEKNIKGSKVTVMSVNDICIGPQLVRVVGRVMKRYPIKWYTHLSQAAGCNSDRMYSKELTIEEALFFLFPTSY